MFESPTRDPFSSPCRSIPKVYAASGRRCSEGVVAGTVNLSRCVRVLACVGSGMEGSGRSRSSGGDDAGDLVPDSEPLGHLAAPLRTRHEVSTRPEVRGDHPVRRAEPLRLPGRVEPLHRPLASSGGLVRVLGSVARDTSSGGARPRRASRGGLPGSCRACR